MALSDITFNRGQGGLGRPLPGEDHLSGFLFYTNTLPSGFGTSSTSDRIKHIFSISEAESLGITNGHLGETLATGTLVVSGTASAGDIVNVKINGTSIASATVVGTSSTAVALTISNAINTAGVYSATASGVTASVTAPAGTGAQTLTLTTTVTTATSLVVTSSGLSGGIASLIDQFHYHISEYFRIQPKGDLYVGIYDPAVTFDEITTIQNFSAGKIRQLGIYTTATTFANSQLTTIQTKVDALKAVHKPIQVLYGANVQPTGLTSLTALTGLSNENVSLIIGQDGGGVGLNLYKALGKSITCVGAALGAVSLSKIQENIGWVDKFNMSNGIELETVAFATGDLYTDITDSQLDSLNTASFIFLRKHTDIDGSYFNDSWTAISQSDDYATIENNRAIDKATRGIRKFLLPQLNSPLYVNSDGTLSAGTIGLFQDNASKPVLQMQKDGEISAFQITINPVQDVLTTSELVVNVIIVPVGTTRQIVVNIGFTVSIA